MKQKILFILIFILISSITLYSQVKKEVRIFKGGGPEIEVVEDEDIEIGDGDFEQFDLPPLRRIIDKLDLSESQEKEFRKLRYELQKKQTDLRAKIRTAQIELRELMDADKIDRNLIEKKIKEIADYRLKLQLNRLDHWFNVYKILDEKQQKIWKKHFNLNGPDMRMMWFFDKGEKKRERFRFW